MLTAILQPDPERVRKHQAQATAGPKNKHARRVENSIFAWMRYQGYLSPDDLPLIIKIRPFLPGEMEYRHFPFFSPTDLTHIAYNLSIFIKIFPHFNFSSASDEAGYGKQMRIFIDQYPQRS